METSGTPPIRAGYVQAADGTWEPLMGGAEGGIVTGATPQPIGIYAQNSDGAWAPWGGGTPTGPDGPIEPGDLDARYVKKAGDTMTGRLIANAGVSFGAAIASSPTDNSKHLSFSHTQDVGGGSTDFSKGVHLYDGNDDLGINVSSTTMNFVTRNGGDKFDFWTGGVHRARVNSAGVWIPDGHSVTTPTLIVAGQDSDERYLLRTEYAPSVEEAPVDGILYGRKDQLWVAVPAYPEVPPLQATIGDIKSGFQIADHAGWVILDGRATTTLTASQQTQAIGLGFDTNLPDAAGAVPMQNGGLMGLVSGSNERVLTQANLPAVDLTTDEQGLHRHTMRSVENDNGKQNLQNLFMGKYDTNEQLWNGGMDGATINNDNYPQIGAAMEGAGAHTHTLALGGSGTALDITPKAISVNQFVYLGA